MTAPQRPLPHTVRFRQPPASVGSVARALAIAKQRYSIDTWREGLITPHCSRIQVIYDSGRRIKEEPKQSLEHLCMWYYYKILIIIIIIRQPLCPVVGRRPQHAVSKLACLVLSSAISCCSSICPGRFSTAWLISLVVFSCHMVSKW